MNSVHTSKTKIIDGFEYCNVVVRDGDEYRVEQHDIEHGKVWNVTPVINFPTIGEAIAFADDN